jgi:glycosyltransferase involved in cell wall biosynthesis
MIVKNSGEILRQTLRSFLPHVTHFCICDTGSTDNTQEILIEETELYSGFLFKEDFVDFSHNRNLVLERAEQLYPDCYYITIDDSYTLENAEAFAAFFEAATDPAYLVFIRNEETQYLSTKISTKGMRYRYRIHEIIDPPEQPRLVRDFLFLEHRPADHKKRTAERAEFDLACLRKDLKDYPKDPRLMFYIARTLYNQDKLLEAAQWFRERILLDGSRYEKYQSMIYITLIAERTSHEPKELLGLYLGIYELFPEYNETLYYAAVNAAELGYHKKAIKLLEKAYYSPVRAEFCNKHIVLQNEVPKMLCSYYFKTDLQKCVPFLYRHYIANELEFDYVYESYIRHIFRIRPVIDNRTSWVVYSDNLAPTDFRQAIQLSDAMVFDQTQQDTYKLVVTNYAVDWLLVLNRVDRIPFFPNIKNIFLLITKDVPEGGSLECFPALRGIVAKDELHAARLKEKYLSGSAARLVIELSKFLLLISGRPSQ